MVQTFGTFKSLADRLDREAIERTRRAAANATGEGDATAEDTPLADAAQLPTMTHQERVNAEMFKAIEILGRKLDRHNEAQSDAREALNRRLALIESAATVDEKTGKLYLPVVMEAPAVAVAPAAGVPKWMLATTLLSGAVAVLALAIVVFRPVPPSLTEQQLAVLNALADTRMGALNGPLAPNAKDSGNWQPVEAAEDTPPPASELAAPAQPSADTATAAQSPATAAPADDALATAPPQPEAPPAANDDAAAQDNAIEATPADSTASAQDAAPAPAAEAPAPAPVAPPVSLTAPDAAPAAPAMPEAVTKAVTARDAAADTATPAPQKTTPAKTEKAKAKAALPEGPPPLVAGLDIGRDANLPQDLVPVETRAMEGVPAAQHDLATLYAAGKQVPQDYKRAVYWFAQAADGGIANADYNLGVMFQQGLGVKKDPAKAIGWYAKAADLGHPEAMYNLGIAYIEGVGAKRNVDEGIKYFTQAADAGVAQAAFNLGVLYESGFGGGIDLATARSWYEKAAKTGHKDARAALARLDAQMSQQQADAPPIARPSTAAAPTKTTTKTAVPAAAALTDADMVEPPQSGAPVYANDLVGKVQRALIRNGLLPAPASGVMDARTEDAIRAWQAAHNLPTDGVPSLDLLGQLNAESAAKASSGSTGGSASPPPRIPHHQF